MNISNEVGTVSIKDLAIANLKAVKRSVKEVPDQFRATFGYVSRRITAAPHFCPLGIGIDSPSRPFQSDPATPVRVVSPSDGHFMTTFFDVDAFSPSGRYLAATQVPFVNRIPIPGDAARVCVIDLEEQTCRALYETRGWGAQLGANVQWGADDDTLFCNDVRGGRGTGVSISRASGTARYLDGPVYGTTPDRRFSFSADLSLVNAIIPGYGVPDPLLGKRRQTERVSTQEGIWRTDLESGKTELFMSLSDIVSQLPDQQSVAGGRYYVFNVKVNRQGTRLFAVLFSRKVPLRGGWPTQLVTMNIDGSGVRLAMPDRLWRIGGHHPSWTADGDHILMNLRLDGKRMAFVKFRFDGSNLQAIAPGHKGSGHPSLRPTDERYLLTDSYVSEGFKAADGSVPLRLIDLQSNEERAICRVDTRQLDGPRRIDPHPVWERSGQRIAFNASIDGYRQVLVAGTTGL